uniref:Si:dkey-6n21.13 n=1 Tax=Neogobius melanostomus TaxID=47308 RepID=A0A8C6U5A1_9GOBI
MAPKGELHTNTSVSSLHDLLNLSGAPSPTLLAPSCNIDESYKYIFLPICYSFTFRWNASLIYMVNLASTDFMYSLSLPFLVASYVMRDRWVFGDFMCRLVRFLFYFNLYCSIFFLTCISVHRYLGICHPMKTITLESKKAVKFTCIVVWTVVFALTCPIFRFAQTGSVTRLTSNKEFSLYVPYGIFLHVLGFFIPFTIIAWCYSHTQRRDVIFLGAHSPYANRRRKSIKTIITITLLFALCFFPFHVTRTIFFILKVTKGVPCHTMTMVSMCYKITRPLASFNAWLNALLYFLTKDKAGVPPHYTYHLSTRWYSGSSQDQKVGSSNSGSYSC